MNNGKNGLMPVYGSYKKGQQLELRPFCPFIFLSVDLKKEKCSITKTSVLHIM
jgi:hypothetical protein